MEVERYKMILTTKVNKEINSKIIKLYIEDKNLKKKYIVII